MPIRQLLGAALGFLFALADYIKALFDVAVLADVRLSFESGHSSAQLERPLWATSGLMHRSKQHVSIRLPRRHGLAA
jgi:hypothetical protein